MAFRPSNAKVSVIIPCFNSARYLESAIDSVVEQDYERLEIIVVDDGSVDTSAQIARAYGDPVHVLSQPNAGASAARNTGVRAANGDLLGFLDADDVWLPGKLKLQIAALQERHTDCVFGHAEQFISPELPDDVRASLHCPDGKFPARLPSAMLIPRHLFLDVGYFDEELELGEVVDWLARAEELGLDLLVLPEVVFRRRLHDANTGIRKRASRTHYARVLKAALDRRRKEASAVTQ